MNFVLILILSVALNLAFYSQMNREGAMLSRVSYWQVVLAGLFYGFWQLFILWAGGRTEDYLVEVELGNIDLPERLTQLIALFILIAVAMYLFYQGERQKDVHESRQDQLNIHRLLTNLLRNSLTNYGVGVALGFCHFPVKPLALPVVVFAVLAAVLGVFNGRTNGVETRFSGYDIAGLLFLIAGAIIYP